MTKTFEPFEPFSRPPTAKTVREVELDRLLKEALPYLIGLGAEQASEKLDTLIEAIVREAG